MHDWCLSMMPSLCTFGGQWAAIVDQVPSVVAVHLDWSHLRRLILCLMPICPVHNPFCMWNSFFVFPWFTNQVDNLTIILMYSTAAYSFFSRFFFCVLMILSVFVLFFTCHFSNVFTRWIRFFLITVTSALTTTREKILFLILFFKYFKFKCDETWSNSWRYDEFLISILKCFCFPFRFFFYIYIKYMTTWIVFLILFLSKFKFTSWHINRCFVRNKFEIRRLS